MSSRSIDIDSDAFSEKELQSPSGDVDVRLSSSPPPMETTAIGTPLSDESGGSPNKEMGDGGTVQRQSLQYSPSPSNTSPVPVCHMALEATKHQDEHERGNKAINECLESKPIAALPMEPPVPVTQRVLAAINDQEDDMARREKMRQAKVAENATDERESGETPSPLNLNDPSREDGGDANKRRSSGHNSSITNSSTPRANTSSIANSSTPRATGATIVYRGSDAQWELASPSHTPASEGTDSQQPSVFDSHQIEIPNAFRVESMAYVHAALELPWYKRRHGKMMILVVAVLAVGLVLLTVFLMLNRNEKFGGDSQSEPTLVPSSMPSLAPSYDPRPTLEVVRSRGQLRCGLNGSLDNFFENNAFTVYCRNMCRSVASVVLGDPEKVKTVFMSLDDRFIQLRDRQVDILIYGDEHTIRREISEVSSGAGLLFSTSVFATQTAVVYVGEKSFVNCAEKRTRFGDPCSNLKICVTEFMFHLIKSFFPADFILPFSTLPNVLQGFIEGQCNVLVADYFVVMSIPELADGVESGQYAVGSSILDSHTRALAVRNDDPQWHDIIEGTLEANYRGFVNNVTENESLCPIGSSNSLNIEFMNAPYCVGSSTDIFLNSFPWRILRDTPFIKGVDDTTVSRGQVSAPPPGILTCSAFKCSKEIKSDTLEMITKRKYLNCAVISSQTEITAMSKLYCHAIAAAIFLGDSSAVNITLVNSFSESMEEFSDGRYDIVAGENRFGIKGWSPDMSGWSPDDSGRFEFSVPYYYMTLDDGKLGKGISLVTREDDRIFSSFVNAVFFATVYAVQNGITKHNSEEMPLIELFGDDLRWMLRDVIFYIGNYDDIYYESHGLIDGQDIDRGYNEINPVPAATILLHLLERVDTLE